MVSRIAVEELEAWFFGDIQAVAKAFPGVPTTLGATKRYRNPDRISGGTWEALNRELAKAGHVPGGKITTARAISAHMDPGRNRSASFRAFQQALLNWCWRLTYLRGPVHLVSRSNSSLGRS